MSHEIEIPLEKVIFETLSSNPLKKCLTLVNWGILSLGADIRGIDLRQRKVPQGSPLLLQQRIESTTRRRIINKLMTMVTPLSWGDNAW